MRKDSYNISFRYIFLFTSLIGMGIAVYIGIKIIYVAIKDDGMIISVIIGIRVYFLEGILNSEEVIFGT